MTEDPTWDVYPVQSYRIDLVWEQVYGSEWKFLQGVNPCSTVLAVGSPIHVYPKGGLVARR